MLATLRGYAQKREKQKKNNLKTKKLNSPEHNKQQRGSEVPSHQQQLLAAVVNLLLRCCFHPGPVPPRATDGRFVLPMLHRPMLCDGSPLTAFFVVVFTSARSH